MGLSRRQFPKEFKLAAVRRLEQGVSIAELERKVGQQTLEIDFLGMLSSLEVKVLCPT